MKLGKFTAEGLQSFLEKRGFYKDAIDGKFGPRSRAAWPTPPDP